MGNLWVKIPTAATHPCTGVRHLTYIRERMVSGISGGGTRVCREPSAGDEGRPQRYGPRGRLSVIDEHAKNRR